MTHDADVLISGAGPTGLSLACVLAQAGISVRIFEQGDSLPRDLRAGSFHPPTLEMLATIGVAEDFSALGIKVPRWQIRDRHEGPIVEWDLGVLADDTPYPHRLHCEQFKLTPLLMQRLEQLGGKVEFGMRCTGATQDADGATILLDGPDGTQTFRGRYVIGADGARSAVREAAGITYDGFTWQERFLVMGTYIDLGQKGFTPNAYVADPDEWVAIFKMPYDTDGAAAGEGLWRVLVPTSTDIPTETVLSAEFVESRLQALCPSPKPYDIEHRSIYQVHQRVASDFVNGRLVLIGDAAHANNPLGAFGLNGGIHDAFNLGEKLLAILAGASAEEMLGRYNRQRRLACTDFVQAQSIGNKKMLEERDPATRQANFDRLRGIAADRAQARDYLLRSSMIASVRAAAALA